MLDVGLNRRSRGPWDVAWAGPAATKAPTKESDASRVSRTRRLRCTVPPGSSGRAWMRVFIDADAQRRGSVPVGAGPTIRSTEGYSHTPGTYSARALAPWDVHTGHRATAWSPRRANR